MSSYRYYVQSIDNDATLPFSSKTWSKANELFLSDVTTGNKPKLTTKLRVLYNKTSMFFNFECEDDFIFSNYTERDDPVYRADVIEVFFAPHERTLYYEVNISPKNIVFDAKIRHTGEGKIITDSSWDAGITSYVYQKPGSINYQFVLPFNDISAEFAPEKDQHSFINFYRIDHGKDRIVEHTAWVPTGQVNFHMPEMFGEIIFC